MKYVLALLTLITAADAQVFCHELYDDCRYRIIYNRDGKDLFIIDDDGKTSTGRWTPAGTGIPYSGLIDVNSPTPKILGRYRWLDDGSLLFNMVIYRPLEQPDHSK